MVLPAWTTVPFSGARSGSPQLANYQEFPNFGALIFCQKEPLYFFYVNALIIILYSQMDINKHYAQIQGQHYYTVCMYSSRVLIECG